MDRQLMGQIPGGGAQRAPAAARPGGGTGNIPYAKGLMSGAFGAITSRGPERTAPNEPIPGGASPPASAAPSGGGPPSPMGGPPMGGVPQGPGQTNPTLDPTFYFDIQGMIMMALIQAAESPEGPY